MYIRRCAWRVAGHVPQACWRRTCSCRCASHGPAQSGLSPSLPSALGTDTNSPTSSRHACHEQPALRSTMQQGTLVQLATSSRRLTSQRLRARPLVSIVDPQLDAVVVAARGQQLARRVPRHHLHILQEVVAGRAARWSDMHLCTSDRCSIWQQQGG